MHRDQILIPGSIVGAKKFRAIIRVSAPHAANCVGCLIAFFCAARALTGMLSRLEPPAARRGSAPATKSEPRLEPAIENVSENHECLALCDT